MTKRNPERDQKRNQEIVRAFDETPAYHRVPEAQAARRTRALSLRLAGMTWQVIADQLGVTVSTAQGIVRESLRNGENRNVEEMRATENARLDRAQSAIWGRVLQGDDKAVNTFLRISQQRAALNGLNAPSQMEISIGVRQEMEAALKEFEAVVLEGETDPDPDPDPTADGQEEHIIPGQSVRTDRAAGDRPVSGEMGALLGELEDSAEGGRLIDYVENPRSV